MENFCTDNYYALQWLDKAFSSASWVFAKTMPENPHEYTLRKDWDSEYFDKAVTLIRRFGYKTKFKGRYYTQFNVADHFYWTMGAPIEKTILINRAFIDKDAPHPYDDFADKYDSWFSSDKSKAEDSALGAMLPGYCHGATLDIGCGTGLLLSLSYEAHDCYFGIDPSKGMLSILKTQYPSAVVLQSRYEDFAGVGFDSIVSLYGSINYTAPECLRRLDHQLNPGGSYFLMFLAESYSPVTHQLSGKNIPCHQTSAYSLPAGAELIPFGNYIIAKGVKDACSLWE